MQSLLTHPEGIFLFTLVYRELYENYVYHFKQFCELKVKVSQLGQYSSCKHTSVKCLTVPFKVVPFGVCTPGPEPLPLLETSLKLLESSTV
jgi:hypothetical protein